MNTVIWVLKIKFHNLIYDCKHGYEMAALMFSFVVDFDIYRKQ